MMMSFPTKALFKHDHYEMTFIRMIASCGFDDVRGLLKKPNFTAPKIGWHHIIVLFGTLFLSLMLNIHILIAMTLIQITHRNI